MRSLFLDILSAWPDPLSIEHLGAGNKLSSHVIGENFNQFPPIAYRDNKTERPADPWRVLITDDSNDGRGYRDDGVAAAVLVHHQPGNQRAGPHFVARAIERFHSSIPPKPLRECFLVERHGSEKHRWDECVGHRNQCGNAAIFPADELTVPCCVRGKMWAARNAAFTAYRFSL